MSKISVLFPVRNAQPFLREAIQSIQRQTFCDFELLLIYSPSTDNSREILDACASQDRRLKVIDAVGSNLAACLNEGLQVARGDFIARMDADDVAYSTRFERQLATFALRPELGMLGSAVRYTDALGNKGRTIKQPQGSAIEQAFYWGCPFTHSSVMIRHAVLKACGGYRELFTQAEDYDLWLRLHDLTQIDNLSETLLDYRLHATNSTKLKALEGRQYAFFAQGAWLARRKNVSDPLENLTLLPEPTSLPLAKEEIDALYSRVLADSAHLLGDVQDDPQGTEWWEHMCALVDKTERKKAITKYYLRCARFYASRNKRRCLQHFMAALQSSPCLVTGYCLKILRQMWAF